MNASEPAVEHREQLIHVLSEASEIEHGLMCCYLYAAFSLKRSDPAWSAEEAEAVASWRRELLSISRDEMLHLTIVSNVLNAVGGAPHLFRQNFPVFAGYHPSGVVLFLAPFSRATLEHFVYMERPEGSQDLDGAGFEPTMQYERRRRAGTLVPSAMDYGTVGQLYQSISDGLAELAGRLGPQALFIGDPRLQLDAGTLGLSGLDPVTDLASAQAGIQRIVAQGEGSTGRDPESHYARFSAVLHEYLALTERNPSFAPALPAATHPVMRWPADAVRRVHVVLEPAASLLDLANGLYALMLRALETLLSPVAFDPAIRPLAAELATDAMRFLTPIAERLASLPANPAHPGVNAGLSFAMSRSLRNLPDPRAAVAVLSEWCDGLARECARQQDVLPEVLHRAAAGFQRYATTLRELADRVPAAAVPIPASGGSGDAAAPASVAADAADAEAGSGDVEVAVGRDLTVYFEAKRCIHSRHCVLEAPQVFLANTPGEWIFPDRASTEHLLHVARSCPSGAIRYRRSDGGADEAPPPVNEMRVRENGPLAVHAELHLHGAARQDFRATLCRCGASRNKPYCDGSHVAASFTASGEPATVSADPLALRDGPLTVTPIENGPLKVEGNLELCAGTGRTVLRCTRTRLCRCGQSGNKPFCDGSHTRVGFVAPGA